MPGFGSGGWGFALSAALDALVACGFVAWAARRRPRPLGLLAGAAAVAALLLAKLAVMRLGGLNGHFGLMHVVWLDLVVVVPLAAALLGALAWRGGGLLVRAVVVLGLLLAPVGAYASLVEPGRLVVERALVPLDPARVGERPLRIAVLADLQFEELGEHEREAVRRAMAERPDLIVLPGDFHQGSEASFARQLPEIRALLRELSAPGGVFAVQGDQETPAKARRVFAGTGVRLLEDELATTRAADRRVVIGGIRLHWRNPDTRAFVARLDRRAGAEDVRILLAHRPDAATLLPAPARVDLVISGHTHGGQLQLPLLGPLTTASGVPDEVAAGGLHDLGGRRIYVSRGIGVERGQAPKLRLGAPPEVSVLDLR